MNNPEDENQDPCQNKCPDSPPPGFHMPDYPDAKYYDGLPTDRKETVKGSKEEKIAEAKEKTALAEAVAENAKQAAKSAYDIAKAKLDSAKTLRDLKITNKKNKIWRGYIHCLREALPKDHPSDKPIEQDTQISARKKAICIAQLKQQLADAELEYINDYLSSCEEWAVADNNWRVAQNKYEADQCRAEKQENVALCAADVEWRQGISTALSETQGK